MENKKKKSPWVAFFLSFILMGLGQMYVGKKLTFSLLLIFADLLLLIFVANGGTPSSIYLAIAIFLIRLAVANDSYNEAISTNERK